MKIAMMRAAPDSPDRERAREGRRGEAGVRRGGVIERKGKRERLMVRSAEAGKVQPFGWLSRG
jgi:hypothetical protein